MFFRLRAFISARVTWVSIMPEKFDKAKLIVANPKKNLF
jgi:hypothetical protein